MPELVETIKEFKSLKKYPQQVFYAGDVALLDRLKISIIGTRKPSKYSRQITQQIASSLAKRGICVVSGGAMGIDAVAHLGAGVANTIVVLPCGIDVKYPAVNKNLLADIERNGLLLSQFAYGFRATPWSFVLRNELVVALGDVLVVSEADLNSGSMRSVEFAQKMGKKIFVLPQRLGESEATNKLVRDGLAEVIYDVEQFCDSFVKLDKDDMVEDEFLAYCKTNPTYDDVLAKFASRVFEAELSEEIKIVNGRVNLNQI